MTQEQRITELTQAIGNDIKTLLANDGTLASLQTTAKTSLVAAINELKAAINGSSSINDSAPTNSTTATYSVNKINQTIDAAIAALVGGAGSAYDTLLELQNELTGNDTAINNLVTAVGNRVRYDSAQTLDDTQKLTACTNIGVGNYDHNFVNDYNLAKL